MQWISWYIWYIIFKTFNTYTELKQWMFYKYSTLYSRYCGILRHFCDRVKNECCRCNKCSTFTKQLLYMHMSSAIKWKCVFGAELPLQNKDIIESICIYIQNSLHVIIFRFEENGGQTEQRRIDDLNEVRKCLVKHNLRKLQKLWHTIWN